MSAEKQNYGAKYSCTERTKLTKNNTEQQQSQLFFQFFSLYHSVGCCWHLQTRIYLLSSAQRKWVNISSVTENWSLAAVLLWEYFVVERKSKHFVSCHSSLDGIKRLPHPRSERVRSSTKYEREWTEPMLPFLWSVLSNFATGSVSFKTWAETSWIHTGIAMKLYVVHFRGYINKLNQIECKQAKPALCCFHAGAFSALNGKDNADVSFSFEKTSAHAGRKFRFRGEVDWLVKVLSLFLFRIKQKLSKNFVFFCTCMSCQGNSTGLCSRFERHRACCKIWENGS